MKFKRIFSGILAAITAAAVVSAPIPSAIADDTTLSETEGKIIINHANSGGTYTAYPIFTGEVEVSTDTETNGRLVINNVEWHENLTWNQLSSGTTKSTVYVYTTENSTIDGNQRTGYITQTHINGLYSYIYQSGVQTGYQYYTFDFNGESLYFIQLFNKYSNNNYTNYLNFGTAGELTLSTSATSSQYAEAMAKLLNLTSTSSIANTITNDSSFYAAFAEAAVAFSKFGRNENGEILTTSRETDENGNTITVMGDVRVDDDGNPVNTLVSYKFSAGSDGTATATVPQGYYVVEWVPDPVTDSDGNVIPYTETTPRAIRRSLVLVPPESEQKSVTISAKDTLNVATVDVQFNNKAGTAITDTDDDTTVTGAEFPDEGTWQNAVSMENGAYVNCRITVTLPSNLADYDQYYLALPIMYDYNRTLKGLERVGDGDDVKVYLLDTDEKGNETKTELDIDSDSIIKTLGKTDALYKLTYDSANPTAPSVDVESYAADQFIPTEAFVINDILPLTVGDSNNTIGDKAQSYTALTLAFEFPVQFIRVSQYNTTGSFSIGKERNRSLTIGNWDSKEYATTDDFLKNYINVKAVYSNNPNLQPLTDDDFEEIAGEDGTTTKTQTTTGIKSWLDTDEDPGSVYNPVSCTQLAFANIVTFRLRVQATTPDLIKNVTTEYNGVSGLSFALTKTINKEKLYAVVEKIDATYSILYDTVTNNEFGTSTASNSHTYKIIGWEPIPDDGEIPDEGILKTYSDAVTTPEVGRGRFEILGIDQGTYTLVALNEQASNIGTTAVSTSSKENYKLSQTEYEVKIEATLDQDAAKLFYLGGVSGIVSSLDAEAESDILLGTKADSGLVSLRVIYTKKGLSLPVTGGIGTLIFFAVGGTLVIISTVFIVTRIRMKKQKF